VAANPVPWSTSARRQRILIEDAGCCIPFPSLQSCKAAATTMRHHGLRLPAFDRSGSSGCSDLDAIAAPTCSPLCWLSG